MSFPLFIAQRFFRNIGRDRKSASNPTITIATAGVAVGLCVMIVTISVISGFKREITSKVNGFASDIEILDLRSLTSPEGFPITADAATEKDIRQWPNVEGTYRVAQKMGIIKTNDNFQGVTLKGLTAEYDTTFLANSLIDGRLPKFSPDRAAEPDPVTGAVGSNEIAVSRQVASDLGLKVGDRVYAYFFEETIKMRRFKISGIYSTNMAIFDKNFIIGDFATVAQLNGWNDDQCSSIEVRLSDVKSASAAIADPHKIDETMATANAYCAQHPDPSAVPRRALSVREHYQQVFSWLQLLDFNMVVILILMLCVAGFTMISGLLILILERTQTIGILKALGATNSRIRSIFLHFAALITVRGLLIGDFLAFALILAQQHFGFIHLDPASYYVDTVPVSLQWLPIVMLNLLTLLLTTIALLAPSFIITRIQPAKAIRFE